MSWQSIVVGVDASPEAAGAAAFAVRMSQRAGTTCHLVHAARDVWASVGVEEGVDELWHALVDQARANITAVLAGVVPRELVDEMTIRLGRAPIVLKQAVTALGAELVVLGGKHHSAVGRWLGGSTSLNVTRTTDEPLLVVAGATAPDATEYYRMLEELLKRDVWPLIRTSGAERLVRYGLPVETLLREATAWQADLLVVGSHGRGWAERVLVGSVTERLLNHLPTSVLVVPVGAAVLVEDGDVREAEVPQHAVAIA